jgi:hypothetical protein
MFETGDIFSCYAPTVGYRKYHLCIFGPKDDKVGWFLFINSDNNFESDFVLTNDDIDCIPKNDTGLSIISCSFIVRLNASQLNLYQAQKLGILQKKHVTSLVEFLKTSKALTRPEKLLCIDSLSAILQS